MIQSIKEKIENLLYPGLRPYGRNKRDHLFCGWLTKRLSILLMGRHCNSNFPRCPHAPC